MKDKKIILLAPRLPFPTDSGSKNVMYNYCKILNEKYNMKVIIISFDDIEYKPEDKPEFIEKVYIIKKIGKLTKLFTIFKYSILMNKLPLQVCLYYSKKTKKYIKDILEIEKPDILISYMARMAEYLKLYDNCYKISDLEDFISLRYKRQQKVDIDFVNPYGNFILTLPNIIQKILLNKKIKKYVLNKEVKLMEKYELEINNFSDKTIFVAQNEVNTYNTLIKDNKAFAIPLGVNVDYFSEYNSKINKEDNAICFLGAMRVAHNEAGVKYFIKEVLPIIIEKKPDIKFYIIGGGVTDEIKKKQNKNIIVTGRVDDVREYVGKCKVFVCPLIFGTGIKTKNLEAMAMKVPIVTTNIGAENIHAKNDIDWYIIDDKYKFAEKVVELIDNNEISQKVANNAYEFVVNNFTWKVAEEKIGELLQEIEKYNN